MCDSWSCHTYRLYLKDKDDAIAAKEKEKHSIYAPLRGAQLKQYVTEIRDQVTQEKLKEKKEAYSKAVTKLVVHPLPLTIAGWVASQCSYLSHMSNEGPRRTSGCCMKRASKPSLEKTRNDSSALLTMLITHRSSLTTFVASSHNQQGRES